MEYGELGEKTTLKQFGTQVNAFMSLLARINLLRQELDWHFRRLWATCFKEGPSCSVKSILLTSTTSRSGRQA
jgi:hypothetical protein